MERRIKVRAIFFVTLGFTVTLIILPLDLTTQLGLILLVMAICTFLYRIPEPGAAMASNDETVKNNR